MNKDTLKILFIGGIIAVSLFVLSLPSVQYNLAEVLGLGLSSTKLSTKKSVDHTIEKAIVDRSIDGDTVVLADGRKVRYLNVDTPETVKENTPVRCYGKEASNFNRDIISGREIFMLSDKESQDKYKRELRIVFVTGFDTTKVDQSVNALLVRKGFARASIISPNTTYASLFQSLENEAKSQKLGVWGNCPKPFEE
jgi:micrococcal nuclease